MKKEAQNILFLARWYPNRYDPMPGLFIRRHAQALALKRNVAVIYLHSVDEPKAPKTETVIEKSPQLVEIKVYYRQRKAANNAIFRLLSAFDFAHAMLVANKELKKEGFRPDFVHVHVLTRLAIFALGYKIFKKVPYGITEHWSRYLPLRNEFGGKLRVFATRLVVKHSAFVTTVTRNLAEAMKAHGLHNKHYVILPNVVDTTLFRPIEHSVGEPFTFVHISCFEDRSKNTSGLLRGIAELQKQRSDFRFVMIGEGQDEAAMHQLASNLGIAPPLLVFTGLLQGQELASRMQQANCLVLFSNYENLPVVIPEAFACGIPVIATRVGGIPEIVNQSNGLLIEAKDEAALVEAMKHLIDKQLQFNSKAIRQHMLDTNSMEAVSRVLCVLYDGFIPEYGM